VKSSGSPGAPAGKWIGLEEAAAAVREGDGRGVKIAVLDSGVEIGHPFFCGRDLVDDLAVRVEDESFVPGDGEDSYGHGTAVAGLIWEQAPKAEIGSFRVLGPNLSARTAQVALAARKAIALGYQVLNCSFACGIGGHLPIYKDWLDEAFLAGVHVVAASGSHLQPEWPAHFSSVLGVDCGAGSLPGRVERVPQRLVEFVCPGENLTVAWRDGGTRTMTGSSFAAARLTGLVARVLSRHPDCDVSALKALLRGLAGRPEEAQPF
jgi:subtilisin